MRNVNKKQYQVTMFCTNGKYRPVACIVNYEQENDDDLSIEKKQEIIALGVQKICSKHYWTKRDLIEMTFTRAKVRAKV